jgi:hypothetical protein
METMQKIGNVCRKFWLHLRTKLQHEVEAQQTYVDTAQKLYAPPQILFLKKLCEPKPQRLEDPKIYFAK